MLRSALRPTRLIFIPLNFSLFSEPESHRVILLIVRMFPHEFEWMFVFKMKRTSSIVSCIIDIILNGACQEK